MQVYYNGLAVTEQQQQQIQQLLQQANHSTGITRVRNEHEEQYGVEYQHTALPSASNEDNATAQNYLAAFIQALPQGLFIGAILFFLVMVIIATLFNLQNTMLFNLLENSYFIAINLTLIGAAYLALIKGDTCHVIGFSLVSIMMSIWY